jgi:hypothetical protein
VNPVAAAPSPQAAAAAMQRLSDKVAGLPAHLPPYAAYLAKLRHPA